MLTDFLTYEHFTVNEETTNTFSWICILYLLPTHYAKKCLCSLDATMGKPIQLDLSTVKRTRSSCSRVKVLVNLKGNFPKSVYINIKNEKFGECWTKVIQIIYDYFRKYCNKCNIQGHNKEDCRNIYIQRWRRKNLKKRRQERKDAIKATPSKDNNSVCAQISQRERKSSF